MKNILFLLFAFLNFTLVSQTTILSEDFNACALPSGWTVNKIGNGPDNFWFSSNPSTINSNAEDLSIDGSCMVIIDDDIVGENAAPLITQIISPPFDATTFSTIRFSVDVFFREVDGTSFTIYVTDGIQTTELVRWSDGDQTGEQANDFVTFTADLSFYPSPNLQLIFEYDDAESWGWWAGFDNVSIIGSGNTTNIILEDFNNCQTPQSWASNIITGDTAWQLGFVNNDNTGSTSMNGSCFAYFDDDVIGEDAPFSSAALISPPFDGTQFANFFLDFDVILRRADDLENLSVGIFDGTEVRPVVSYFTDLGGPNFDEYVHETINLSAFRAPNMRVVFLYDDGDAWGWWVGLDNIKISGEGAINDLCENAFDLKIGDPCLAGNNLTALFTGTVPNCANENVGALWYRYQALQSGFVSIQTNATFNDVVTVFSGDCTTLTAGICDNWDEFGFIGETTEFQANAGTTYYIRVNGLQGAFGIPRGNLCVQLNTINNLPTPPVNDLCSNAIPLDIGADCMAGNNYHATLNGQTPSTNDKSRADIWYSFQASNAQALEIVTNANFSDVIAIYEGDCTALAEIATNHNGGQLLLTNLVPNQTYYLQITGNFATVEGEVCVAIQEVQLPSPPNDICASALPLNLSGICTTTSNLGANFSGHIPDCEPFPTADIWYEVVAPNSGAIKLNTGADFSHVVSVYRGDCNNLEIVNCFNNPDACADYLTAGPLVPGDTYYIQVATAININEYANSGNICLKILDSNALSPVPFNLTVDINCMQTGMGAVNIQASGGIMPYTFAGNSPGDLIATDDSFLVVATDANGCQQSVSGTVNCGVSNCALQISTNATDILCNAANNGIASVLVENNIGTTSFLWSNGETTQQISNLTPGAYSVTVTDDLGCQNSAIVTIEEPALLIAQIASTDETAYNTNDGTVTAQPIGGTAPFSFAWSNGSTSQAQSGLTPGTYIVTITDTNNCATEQSIVVAPFNCTVTATTTQENISCFGANDGQVSIILMNGTAPYTYEWSSGETNSSIQNLSAGNYTVTATDSNGCPQIQTININEPTNIIANINTTGETANNANDGSASANPVGGTGTYSYLWSNGATTATIDNLAPTNYTVTITDENNCQHIETITITAFNCALMATIQNVQPVTCPTAMDGGITLMIENTIGNLNINWSNGQTTDIPSLNNLPAGNYAATITDQSACLFIINTTIEAPNPMQTSFVDVAATNCLNNAIGAATISVTGGTAPYQFAWSNGGTGMSQDNLAAGNYVITITDNNNCESLANVEIEVIDNENPIVSTQNIILSLDNNGMANISVEDIDNGSSDNCSIANLSLSHYTFDCSNLGDNEVTLFVEDENQNQNMATAMVTVVDNQTPTIECPDDIISTDCEGQVFYPLPMISDNCLIGEPTLASGLASGANFPEGENIVRFTISDTAGNTTNCEFLITVTNPLVSEVTIEKVLCFGEANGAANLQLTGGEGNYTYLWDDANGQTTATATNLVAGTYSVTATDENGCEIIAAAVVTQPDLLSISVTDLINETTTDANDGAISIDVEGGTPPYFIEWYRNAELFIDNMEDLNNIPGGDYLAIITDANGCLVESEIITIQTIVGTTELPTTLGSLAILPNPNNGLFVLKAQLKQATDLDVRIFDVAGKLVHQQVATNIMEEQVDFSFPNIPNGVYYMDVLIEDFYWREQLVIID